MFISTLLSVCINAPSSGLDPVIQETISGQPDTFRTASPFGKDCRRNSKNASVAVKGATIAKNARLELESELGHSVISSENAIGHITAEDELPINGGNSLSKDNRESF